MTPSHPQLHRPPLRKAAFLALGLLIAATAPSAAPAATVPVPASRAKDACHGGLTQYHAGDVLKAIASLERCVEREDRNREAWATLATARLEAGRFPEAADAFARAHALKAGDTPFLVSYLDALEGAGRAQEKVPVLRALSESRQDGLRYAERLLALVDSLGKDRLPDDRLFALEKLGQGPDAILLHQEMLAAAYLSRGSREKSQAEYRGLLSRRPENGEYWAGLAASIAPEDPAAARDCYRKAIFFSNAASLRSAYEKEIVALAAPQKTGSVPSAAPAKPIDAQAAGTPVPPASAMPPASVPSGKVEGERQAAEAEKAEKEKQEKLAREEKARQDRQAQETAKKAEEEEKLREKLAKEEKARQDRLAKEALKKAEVERKLQEKLAKEERDRQERIAKEAVRKAEEERRLAEKRSREERERLAKDSLAKAEQERMARLETDRKAKEEKEKQERLAKEEKAKREKAVKEARDRFVKDSLAKVEQERLALQAAEKKAKEERERLASEEAKARKRAEERERFVRDSLAKVETERLAKVEAERKAREARGLFVKDSLAKVEKDRLARLEVERKAKEAAERFVKDSLARVEQERLAKLEEERKVRETRERFVKDSLARVERERLAMLEAERKAREEQERKERLAREKLERHDRAISLYRAGRLDSADILFRVVIEESPTPDAFYFGGRTHLDKGRPDRALDLLLKAPKDRPGIDGLVGKAYLGKGRSKEALAAFERQFAKTPEPGLLEEICVLRKPAADPGPWAACMARLSDLRPTVGKYHEELAIHHRKQGDKGKSLERWARLQQLEPAHGEANYQLGMDWAASGVHDRAVPCLEQAVAAFPERREAWKQLAKGQAALGRKDQAWTAYQKAASLLPADLDVARGRLALAKDPGREAELPGAYQAVLKLAPADAEANLGYAQLRYHAKDYPAAEKHFRLGIKDSKLSQPWGQYGRSLLETRKLDEAAAALQKAVSLGETSLALKFDLARLHLDKGDADKAEALVKQIQAQAPAEPEPYYWLGRIAGKRQQVTVQEEFLRKANQLRPDEARYAEALARLFRDRDENKQAISVLAPLEAKLGSEGRMLLADCLAASGEGARALDLYSGLFRKEPGPVLLSRRMDVLVRMGKAGEAADAARGTAFGNHPEVRFSLAKAHLALAETHVLKGDLDLAVALMKGALDADGHRPEYHHHLGLAYYRKGKPGKAMAAFTDALRYRVDYPDAVWWKGICLIEGGRPLEARDFFGELSQHADLRWKARGLMGLARVFEAEGKWEAVEHHLDRSIAAMPLADAMAYLSRVHHKLGRFPEAEGWARKALALEADHVEGTMALAEALAAGKKVPEALGLAGAALRSKPLSCDLMVQNAKLNLEAGRLDSTLHATGKAIQACPQEPMPHFYAGMAMRGSNKPEDAKRHFKSFRKLGGDKKLLPD